MGLRELRGITGKYGEVRGSTRNYGESKEISMGIKVNYGELR